MYKSIINTLFAVGLITGCGSSSSSEAKTEIVGYSGFLVDAAVSGASWSCGEASGITGEGGSFGLCPMDATVTFSVGNLILGESQATDDFIFTPQDLAGVDREETADQGAIRLATALLCMDEDGDSSNGIQITLKTRELFNKILKEKAKFINKTLTETRSLLELSEEEANQVVNKIVENNPNIEKAPTIEDIISHLQETNGDIADGTQPAGAVERRPILDKSTN